MIKVEKGNVTIECNQLIDLMTDATCLFKGVMDTMEQVMSKEEACRAMATIGQVAVSEEMDKKGVMERV